jgi:Putative translation factor (SUA5)
MEIMSLTKDNFQAAVEAAARVICRGGTVIAPTDTVYGLLANAANEKAIERIFAVKLRPKNKPLPIFVKNMAMAKKLDENFPGTGKIFGRKVAGQIHRPPEAQKGNEIVRR